MAGSVAMRKPVARISTSASWTTPSRVRTPSGVTSSIGVVTSSTWLRPKVFRYRFETDGRLQPKP